MENCPKGLLDSMIEKLDAQIADCAAKDSSLAIDIESANAKVVELTTDLQALDETEKKVAEDWAGILNLEIDEVHSMFIDFKQEKYGPQIAKYEEIVANATSEKESYASDCAPLSGHKEAADDLLSQFETFTANVKDFGTALDADMLIFASEDSNEENAVEEAVTESVATEEAAENLVDDSATNTVEEAA